MSYTALFRYAAERDAQRAQERQDNETLRRAAVIFASELANH